MVREASNLQQLKELHLLKITTGLNPSDQNLYNQLCRSKEARKLCKELDMLYRCPAMQETLTLSPTSERWAEISEMIFRKWRRGLRRFEISLVALSIFSFGLLLLLFLLLVFRPVPGLH